VKPRFVQIVPSRASIPFSLLVLTFALSVAGGSLQQIVPQGDAQPSAVTIQDMQRRLAEASTNLATGCERRSRLNSLRALLGRLRCPGLTNSWARFAAYESRRVETLRESERRLEGFPDSEQLLA